MGRRYLATVMTAVFFILLPALSVGAQANTPPVLSSLKVDYQIEPENVATSNPVFSWTYFDAEDNVQSHIQLEVGISPGDNSMWASGVVATSATYLPYGGSALQPATRYYWRVRAKDGLDWSDWASSTFKTKSAPTLKIDVAEGKNFVASREVSVKLITADPAVTAMSFSVDYGPWSDWELFSVNKVLMLSPADGSKTVRARVKDTLGAVSNVSSDTVVLDTVAPALADNYPRRNATIPHMSFLFTAYVYDINLLRVSMEIDGRPIVHFLDNTLISAKVSLGEGLHNVYIRSEDKAGNVNTLSFPFTIETGVGWTPPLVEDAKISLEIVTSPVVVGEPIRLILVYSNPHPKSITDTIAVEANGAIVEIKNVIIPPVYSISIPITIPNYPHKEKITITVYGEDRALWASTVVPLVEPAPEENWLLVIPVVAGVIVVLSLAGVFIKKKLSERKMVVFRPKKVI